MPATGGPVLRNEALYISGPLKKNPNVLLGHILLPPIAGSSRKSTETIAVFPADFANKNAILYEGAPFRVKH